MVTINSVRDGNCINNGVDFLQFKAEKAHLNEVGSQVCRSNYQDSLSLTTDIGSFFGFNNISSNHERRSVVSQLSAEQGLPFIPRQLNEQEAETLSNQQLKAEYGRHRQISIDSEAKKQKCVDQSFTLNHNREQALHMNKLSSILKQNGQKLGQQALVKIAAGLALYASGVAMEAVGKAMLSCPFTKAAGAALISKGKTLKQRGLQMQKYGQKMELNSKNLLTSGLSLGTSAAKQLSSIKSAWQTLNKIYKQIKTVGDLAKSSMLCAETVGRKRGLSFSVASGVSKATTVSSSGGTKDGLAISQNYPIYLGKQVAPNSRFLAPTSTKSKEHK